jgi:nickel transport system permease protein
MIKRIVLGLSILWLCLMVILMVFGPVIRPHNPYEVDILNKYEEPSSTFPLGTDGLGRCIASRLIEGVRPTLGYAFIVMIFTMIFGLVMGMCAGYFGGVVDNWISFFIQLFLSIPSQVMIFVVVALVGDSIIMIVLAMVLLKWAWYAKMIRDEVISVSTRPFVIFAKIARMSSWNIVKKHIFPTSIPYYVVLMSMNLSWNMLNLTALSFLGFGIAPPRAEWGAMLNEARQVMLLYPQQLLYPGLAITITAASIQIIGDGLHDLFQVRGVHHV